VTFPDLDADGVNDMVCVKTNNNTSALEDGVNILFKGEPPSLANGNLPRFTRITNPGQLKFSSGSSILADCHHSFSESSRVKISGNLNAVQDYKDYLLIGHTDLLGDGIYGRGPECGVKLYSRTVIDGNGGDFFEQPFTNQTANCHNGLLADSGARITRGGSAIDVLLACGVSADAEQNFAYRGMMIFLNYGTDFFAELFQLGGRGFFNPVKSPAGQPGILPNLADPIIFNGDIFLDEPAYTPGAANAMGVGDLDLDSVPDIYFANGARSLDGTFLDYIFRQGRK
jgi:hypothetical protein